jgi:hypothetical protein
VIVHVHVYFPDGTERELPMGVHVPTRGDILHFEGLEGPWYVDRRSMEFFGSVQHVHCFLEAV